MENLTKYATPEVLTVAACLVLVVLGYKVSLKTFSGIAAVASRAGFFGTAAAMLMIMGVGTAGIGGGELVARVAASPDEPEKPGLSDDSLLQLAKECQDQERSKLILDYARARDGDRDTEETRMLAALVEKQSQKGDDKALVAFIDYLKSKEQAKASFKTEHVRLVSANEDGTNAVFTTAPAPSKEKEPKDTATVEKPNKDSLVSIPWAFGLIGLGLASSLCSIPCFRMRKTAHREEKDGTVAA